MIQLQHSHHSIIKPELILQSSFNSSNISHRSTHPTHHYKSYHSTHPTSLTNIQCDNDLPNCIITWSTSNSSRSPGTTVFPVEIICPHDANVCKINCQSPKSCEGVTIIAATSKYAEINIGSTDSGKSMTIYSPGYNGGKLNINCRNGNLCNNNNINGMRVEGYNSSNCSINSANCSDTNIYCSNNKIISTEQAICNINCINKQNKRICNNLNIYTNNGSLDPLFFNCGNYNNACTNTQLYRGGLNQNDKYSNIFYENDKQQWIYEIGNGICGFDTNNPTLSPTKSPTKSPTISPTKSPNTNDLSSFIALDPLYYIIFILTLSLCCVICILMFWMYHQNKFTKELDFNPDDVIINKINDNEFEITSNGSILPKSPIPNNVVLYTSALRSVYEGLLHRLHEIIKEAIGRNEEKELRSWETVLYRDDCILKYKQDNRAYYYKDLTIFGKHLSRVIIKIIHQHIHKIIRQQCH